MSNAQYVIVAHLSHPIRTVADVVDLSMIATEHLTLRGDKKSMPSMKLLHGNQKTLPCQYFHIPTR